MKLIKEQLNLKDVSRYEIGDEINRTLRFKDIEPHGFSSLISTTSKEDKVIYWGLNILNKMVIALNHNEELLYIYNFKDDKEVLKFLDNLFILAEKKGYYNYIKDKIKELKILIDSKKPSKIKELKKGDTKIKIGTFLYTSWGYDQTNVELFRVVKIIGKNYFIIQEITQESSDHYAHGMACEVKEGKEDLNTLPIKAFISNDGHMSICSGSSYKRSLWIHEKGKKHYKSWYA